MAFFRVNIRLKWVIIPFCRCSKILGEAASKKFYNKCSENSSSQIVFRTDIFPKIAVGCPWYNYNVKTSDRVHFLLACIAGAGSCERRNKFNQKTNRLLSRRLISSGSWAPGCHLSAKIHSSTTAPLLALPRLEVTPVCSRFRS